jgi:outer membrane immunogenic protein
MKGLAVVGIAAGLLAVGPAIAADMKAPAPVYTKAPMMAPVFSWTGCYLGGGGGYGMWNQEVVFFDPTVDTALQTGGGRGWFGTVQAGCDYQISSSFVIGAFGDWDFGNLKGSPHFPDSAVGDEKNSWTWAVGGRIGYVIAPQVLAFVSGGYTQAHFDQVDLFDEFLASTSQDLNIPEHTYSGWFLGTGYEYGLNFLMPGLFWKTEYRYSEFSSASLPQITTSTGAATGFSYDSKKFIQTVRSELVWRFNWGH